MLPPLNEGDPLKRTENFKAEEENRALPVVVEEESHELHSSQHSFSSERAVDTAIDLKIPKLKKENLEMLRIVGNGSFCEVHKAWYKYSHFCGDMIAIKRVKKQVEPEQVGTAHIDLIKEAAILSSLSHENIVTIHGINGNVDSNFFIAMEFLVDTLDKRLLQWKTQSKQFSLPRKKNLNNNEMIHRINVALGIAKGMEYLHSRNIIHRDLKPSNVGFDELDTIKIFDFGLARKCVKRNHSSGVLHDAAKMSRRMTLDVGTPRYMAPEIAKSEVYDASADVYSFGLVLWQLLTNQLPYKNITKRKIFVTKVAFGGSRPPLKRVQSKTLRQLLELCWSGNPAARPSFSFILRTLEKI